MLKSKCFQNLVIWAASFVLGSCGPARPVQEKSNHEVQGSELSDGLPEGGPAKTEDAPWLSPARFLQLKVVKGRVSCFSARQELFIPLRTSKDEIYLSQVLPIQNSKGSARTFFTFPEASLGSAIGAAWVSHQLMDGNNQTRDTPGVFNLGHDLSQNLWFLPVSDIFQSMGLGSFLNSRGNSIGNSSGIETHLFILNLRLEIGVRVQIRIYFRMIEG